MGGRDNKGGVIFKMEGENTKKKAKVLQSLSLQLWE